MVDLFIVMELVMLIMNGVVVLFFCRNVEVVVLRCLVVVV